MSRELRIDEVLALAQGTKVRIIGTNQTYRVQRSTLGKSLYDSVTHHYINDVHTLEQIVNSRFVVEEGGSEEKEFIGIKDVEGYPVGTIIEVQDDKGNKNEYYMGYSCGDLTIPVNKETGRPITETYSVYQITKLKFKVLKEKSIPLIDILLKQSEIKDIILIKKQDETNYYPLQTLLKDIDLSSGDPRDILNVKYNYRKEYK